MTNYTELKRLAEQSKDSWVNGKWHTRPTLDIGVDEDDSAYIAAASPDVVLGLIKSLEHTTMAAEAEAKEVDERNAVIAGLRTQNQALVKEMRYIAGISNGQVKRVADQALAAQAEWFKEPKP